MLVTIHINNKKMHKTKTFELSQENYECWILYHAFWLACNVKVNRPIFETDRLIFEYWCIDDFDKNEKWLKGHGELK